MLYKICQIGDYDIYSFHSMNWPRSEVWIFYFCCFSTGHTVKCDPIVTEGCPATSLVIGRLINAICFQDWRTPGLRMQHRNKEMQFRPRTEWSVVEGQLMKESSRDRVSKTELGIQEQGESSKSRNE